MTWVKLDDAFFRNPKVVRAGRDARDLYLAALCYCQSGLTDGLVDPTALRRLAADAEVDGAPALAERLVEVGLWERAEGGYRVHDYHVYNPTADEVRRERAEAAKRQAEWRAKRRAKRDAVTNGVTDDVSNDADTAVVTPSPARTHPGPVPAVNPAPVAPGSPGGSARGGAAPPDPPDPVREEAAREDSGGPAAVELWALALERLRGEMTAGNFETYFVQAEALGLNQHGIRLGVPLDWQCQTLAGRFRPLIQKALRAVSGRELAVEVVVAAASSQPLGAGSSP